MTRKGQRIASVAFGVGLLSLLTWWATHTEAPTNGGPAPSTAIETEPRTARSLVRDRAFAATTVRDASEEADAEADDPELHGVAIKAIRSEGDLDRGIVGIHVAATNLDGAVARTCTTKDRGWCSLGDDLPAGPYILTGTHPDWVEGRARIVVNRGFQTFGLQMSKRQTLRCRVVDQRTKAGIAGASVRLAEPRLRVTTDAGGFFEVDRHVTGRYTRSDGAFFHPEVRNLDIFAPGYESQSIYRPDLSGRCNVELIPREQILDGRVTSDDGPVAGARIEEPDDPTVVRAISDSEGRFAVAASGADFVHVSAEGFERHECLMVADTETECRLSKGGRLHGVVVDHVGDPVTDAWLTVACPNDDRPWFAKTEVLGAFVIEHLPFDKTCRVEIVPPDGLPSVILDRISGTVRRYKLPTPAVLRVTVADASTGQRIRRINWTHQGPVTQGGSEVYGDVSQFEVSPLAAGKHTLKIKSTGYATYEARITLTEGEARELNVEMVAAATLSLMLGPSFSSCDAVALKDPSGRLVDRRRVIRPDVWIPSLPPGPLDVQLFQGDTPVGPSRRIQLRAGDNVVDFAAD